MIQFLSDGYYSIMGNLQRLLAVSENYESQHILPQEDIDNAVKIFDQISNLCSGLELPESSKLALRAKEAVLENKNMQSMRIETNHLHDLIRSESETKTFLYIPTAEARACHGLLAKRELSMRVTKASQ